MAELETPKNHTSVHACVDPARDQGQRVGKLGKCRAITSCSHVESPEVKS